jgi:23S rRNA (pseudouridine1915-N3)-methyltransferase
MQIQPQKEFTRRRAPTEKWIGVARAGRSLSSEQFAEMIQAFAPDRFVSFFIGLKSPAGAWDETLSLTSAELSWDLLPVVLLEQIYRAYRIIHHEPYHK